MADWKKAIDAVGVLAGTKSVEKNQSIQINVFLSGSTVELKSELQAISLDLYQLDKQYRKIGIELNIQSCFEGVHTFTSNGEQLQWNEQIRSSDLFVAILSHNAKTYTWSEVDTAIDSFSSTGKPSKILICFLEQAEYDKSVVTGSLEVFQDRLYEQYRNYSHVYSTISDVEKSIRHCINDLYIEHLRNHLEPATIAKSLSPDINAPSSTSEPAQTQEPLVKKDSTLSEKQENHTSSNSSSPFVSALTLLFLLVMVVLGGYHFIWTLGYFRTSGKCGENASWSIQYDTLYISGAGYTNDWCNKYTPWYFKRDSIKNLIIDPNIRGIGQNSFSGLYNLTNVEIPDTTLSLDDNTFSGCTSLVSVFIPSSIRSIGSGVFSSCYNLSEFVVDEKNLCYSTQDGVLFDYEKTQLIQYPAGKTDAEYSISNTVTQIKSSAFSSCGYLVNVTISAQVSSIGANAFENCVGLRRIKLPDALTEIESCTFIGCKNLLEVDIPANVLKIDVHAFQSCDELQSIRFLSESEVSIIGNGEPTDFQGTNATVYYPESWKNFSSNEEWVSYNPSTSIDTEPTSIDSTQSDESNPN